MRNPKWHRDEIILALDLYFSKDRGSIDSGNPKIIEVSKVLNQLPIFHDRPDKEKFRNPNGVTLKLSNFKHFDPDHKGVGMSGGSKLDEIVFNEFYNDREKLRAIATEIRRITDDPTLCEQVNNIEDDEQTAEDSVTEGQVLYKLHKVRERDGKIITRKKEQVWTLYGKLACEACIFEFEGYYGSIGKGYIECHHRTPLANFKVAKKTTLDDLAVVCSNCHRMLHRRIDTITVEDLKTMIKYDRI
ncbi:MAG TPA: HNH endonuclease [Chitinophagaceae bacterium]|nr:HNH endonuclease [Chitinophagaceae bacterium]